MKIKLILIIILYCHFANSQTTVNVPINGCPSKTITTNPEDYNNASNPTGIWNWMEQNFTVYLTSSAGTTGVPVVIVNPFNDQNQNPNLYGIASESMKDYKPENGWELLYKAFGTASQGVTTPYFVLYNRFAGTVRVFANIVNSGEFPYTAAAITLEYDETRPTIQRQTAVLNQLGKCSFSMNEMQRNATHFMPNYYLNSGINNNYFWLYADFNTLFDPCTCGLLSNWHLTIGLINNIEISAKIFGTQTTIVDANPSGNNPNETQLGSFFGTAQQYLKFGSGIISGLGEVSKSANEGMKVGQDLISNSQKMIISSGELIGKQKANNVARILGKLLYEVPKVNMLMNLASSLITFVKKTGDDYNELTNPKPKSIDAIGKTSVTEVKTDLTVTGNLKVSSPYIASTLIVPGSQGITNIVSANPIYNNILGVFNLYEQPKCTQILYNPDPNMLVPNHQPLENTGPVTNSYAHYYKSIYQLKLGNMPKILLNPASNLKIVSVQYQVLFDDDTKPFQAKPFGPTIPGPLQFYQDLGWGGNYNLYSADITNVEEFYQQMGYYVETYSVPNSPIGATFSTPYLNQNCFKDQGVFSYSQMKNIFVRVKVILEPISDNLNSDVDQVIMIHSFPAELNNENGPNYTKTNFGLDLPFDETQYNYGKPGDLLLNNTIIKNNINALGDLTISDNVTFTDGTFTIKTAGNIYFDKSLNTLPSGTKINFFAGKSIFVNPETIVNPEIAFEIDPNLISSCVLATDIIPTDIEIANFCNSSVYDSRSNRLKNIILESTDLIEQFEDVNNLSWDFNLFPNPTTKETNLTFSGNFDTSIEIRVFDVTGSEVLNSTVLNENRTSINVSTLNKGLYFVKVVSNGVTKTKQLIIQ